MGDDIGSGLSSMAVCFDFPGTNVVQLSNWNPYFYRFRCHHPLITQLSFTYEKGAILQEINKRDCSLKIQHRSFFDLNGLKNGPTKHFENSLKKLHFFQRLRGGMNCWGRSH